jgi:hyperosmotically inducible periplasmic protein
LDRFAERRETRKAGPGMKSTGDWALRCVLMIGLVAAIAAPNLAQTASKHPAGAEQPADSNVAREVRHQLQVLPYYSVFDHITFTIQGRTVVLTGSVLRPTMKKDAENSVKSIEGVAGVVNKIEVLPVSQSDDELRRDVYRAIFEDAALQNYAIQPLPSIHIIVKNGEVYLEGTVATDADKRAAGAKAGGVANVAGVKDNLVVESQRD